MNAYLIDSEARTVTPCEVSKDNVLGDLYRLIKCDMVEVVHVESDAGVDHDIWCDEEALVKSDVPPRYRFGVRQQADDSTYHPVAGNGVVLCCNDEGESTPATMPIGQLKDRIRFFEVVDGRIVNVASVK